MDPPTVQERSDGEEMPATDDAVVSRSELGDLLWSLGFKSDRPDDRAKMASNLHAQGARHAPFCQRRPRRPKRRS